MDLSGPGIDVKLKERKKEVLHLPILQIPQLASCISNLSHT
jgi:hypothetical protein